jgi:hypothetical protein
MHQKTNTKDLKPSYFTGGRICDYCAINMDIKDMDILFFFHGTCWQQYRKDGKHYPMPRYA